MIRFKKDYLHHKKGDVRDFGKKINDSLVKRRLAVHVKIFAPNIKFKPT